MTFCHLVSTKKTEDETMIEVAIDLEAGLVTDAIDLEVGLATDATGQEAGTAIDIEVEMTVMTDTTGIVGKIGTVIAVADVVVAEVTQAIVIALALMIRREVEEEARNHAKKREPGEDLLQVAVHHSGSHAPAHTHLLHLPSLIDI